MIRKGGEHSPDHSSRAENALDGQSNLSIWEQTASRERSADNYQFAGGKVENAAGVATHKERKGTAHTYAVKEEDSLWSIASRLVRDSGRTDKSDKFKLDVVKGLIERNKSSIRGLKDNPDRIVPGQHLKLGNVEDLARLGHGKHLNTHHKSKDADRKKESGESYAKGAEAGGNYRPRPSTRFDESGFKTGARTEERRIRRESAPYAPSMVSDSYSGRQNRNDMGQFAEALGMIGMLAGGAMSGNRFGGRGGLGGYGDYGGYGGYGGYDGSRGYGGYGGYSSNDGRFGDSYSSSFYDGRNQQYDQWPQHYKQYQQWGRPQPQLNYSHYSRPQQNFALPVQQLLGKFF